MEIISIRSNEVVYRSIKPYDENLEENDYVLDEEEGLKFTPKAFLDGLKQPSVSRKKLLKNLGDAKLTEYSGLAKLVVSDVRKVDLDILDKNNNKKYDLDVVPSPSKKNISHAHIQATPEFYGSKKEVKRDFSKVKIALARIASRYGWVSEPNDKNHKN